MGAYASNEGLLLTGVGEVALAEFVLLNLEATLDELLGLLAADGHVNSNLLVTLDREGTDSETSLGLDGLLVGEILENLGSLGELITGFTGAQIEDEFLNLDFAHSVVEFLRLLLILGLHSSF